MAQSSKWLCFGLGEAATVDRLLVRWPGSGAAETFTGLEPQGRYRIVQGSAKAQVVEPRRTPVALKASHPTVAPVSDRARSRLSSMVAVPDLTYADLNGKKRSLSSLPRGPLLINLWATWCAPCLKELKEFAEKEDRLRSSGVSILALNVDGVNSSGAVEPAPVGKVLSRLGFSFPAGRASADFIEKLDRPQAEVIYRQRQLPLPTSFLLDAERRLAVVYKGPVPVHQLLADVKGLRTSPEKIRDLAVPFPGRWSADRFVTNPMAVANVYLEGGYPEDAQEYLDRYVEKEGGAPSPGTSEEARKRHFRLADVHHLLGRIRQMNRDSPKAIDHFRAALRCRAGFPPAANDLAWLLATHVDPAIRNGEEALQLAEQACQASGYKQPAPLDTLAAAYAELGRFDAATRTARRALQLARQQRGERTAAEISRRLSLYESRRPFRDDR